MTLPTLTKIQSVIAHLLIVVATVLKNNSLVHT